MFAHGAATGILFLLVLSAEQCTPSSSSAAQTSDDVASRDAATAAQIDCVEVLEVPMFRGHYFANTRRFGQWDPALRETARLADLGLDDLVNFCNWEACVRTNGYNHACVASEARDAKLVDGFAFDGELERVTQDVVGRKVHYAKFSEETKAPERFGPRDRGLLYIDGDIIDGRSRTIPILDMKLVGSYTIAESAKKLREDRRIKAVVMRIESPGGSSMGSDVMWRELKKLAETKPLVVSMGSIAASGGYYVARPAKTVFALPLTVTGSIGIFYGKADISGLLDKVGVNIEVRKTTGRADAESLFRGFTEDERTDSGARSPIRAKKFAADCPARSTEVSEPPASPAGVRRIGKQTVQVLAALA